MMCEVLSVELRGEGLSDEQRIQRDDLLDDIYEHMHDLSAYVRHKVIFHLSIKIRCLKYLSMHRFKEVAYIWITLVLFHIQIS